MQGRGLPFMRRPLIPLSAAFALGVCFARWGAWEARLFLAPLFVLAMVLPFIRKRKISLALLITGFLFLGALAEAESRNLPANSIIFFQSTSRVSVTGKVDSLPEITRNGRRETISFVLSVSGLQSGDFSRAVQGRVQVFLMNSRARPAFHDEMRLEGFLEAPEEARYPGQFDYRRYLASRKIQLIFKGYGRRSVRCLKKGNGSILSLILKTRETIKRHIDRYFPFPEREVISALLIGFQNRIPQPIWDDFARTGTAHLLAVSGLNVSIVGGLLYFFLRLFLPRKWNAFFSLLLVGFYAAISGASAPVLRAAIMGGLLFAGLLIEKDTELLNSLAVAFFFLMVFDTENLFSAGFQLSFLSVLGIFIFMPWVRAGTAGSKQKRGTALFIFQKVTGFFADILTATFAATLATLPLSFTTSGLHRPSAFWPIWPWFLL